MNKDERVVEMARDIEQVQTMGIRTWDGYVIKSNSNEGLAEHLTNKNYRKASEVVEEIEKYILEGATTIESNNSDSLYGAKFAIEKVVLPILEAYKKKYTESEG